MAARNDIGKIQSVEQKITFVLHLTNQISRNVADKTLAKSPAWGVSFSRDGVLYMFKKFIFLLVMIVSLTGCSATGPKFTQIEAPDVNKAKVYFYRPWAMLDGAAAPTVQVNGVDSFEISNGGFHVLDLNPGNTIIAVKEGGIMSNWRAGPLQISLDVQANTTYFVRLTAELANAAYLGGVASISGNYSLGLVNPATATQELRETKKN